ncbi:HlyD family type I secretion periplasmic adaptor subunit [Marinobacterium nitratireducens]|uniref:Membrane fusion protein (MFP) family protein n=1 Tax=Marinobacterium nitratireducens TaxID=518897 RepID=A0A917ZJE6_9GAMM|nr:HlyD family type I secretion periplasmic adaptor subunit [Marinobacterium nitratireducens]GGO83094.1 HlyD family type I secretion periplasmic adaptor subunit [Marinobacterium nitratireducens]
MNRPVSRDDTRFMTSISEAMLEQTPRSARLLLWGMALFILLAIVWANWAQLDEISRGDGEIIPSSQLQVVQNLEGGIVSAILVHEGDLVEKGQVLLRIDDTRFSSSFNENRVREYELIAKQLRLQAEADGTELEMPADFPPAYQHMLDRERNLYNARVQELRTTLLITRRQLEQRRQELREARSRIDQLQSSYNLLLKEYNIMRPLVGEGVISEVEYLRTQRQVNDLKGELSATRLSIPRIESAIAEHESRLEEGELQFRTEARTELNEVSGELARLREAMQGMQDRITRTEVRAPVKGTVKELMVNTVGGVVQPGDDLLNIVPWEDRLLVEARIRPADIAPIKVGLPARVKVSAYDFSIYGGLDAKVVFVSPSTILDEEKKAFYRVRLETETPYLGNIEKPLPLIAGMTVSVDILTGKKTVMDYLLKPILKARDRALTER